MWHESHGAFDPLGFLKSLERDSMWEGRGEIDGNNTITKIWTEKFRDFEMNLIEKDFGVRICKIYSIYSLEILIKNDLIENVIGHMCSDHDTLFFLEDYDAVYVEIEPQYRLSINVYVTPKKNKIINRI